MEGNSMYEHYQQPLLARKQFLKRMFVSSLIGISLISLSLYVGMAGYHFLEGLSWLDSLLNASMILSGMGPLHNPITDGGKLFASFYALFSGICFIVIVGVMFAPLYHRFLHKFHLDMEDEVSTEPEK
jgi:hypothetical protein